MARKTAETKNVPAVKEANQALAVAEKHQALLDEEDVDSRDLMLSKILAMQGLSKLVQNEQANLGDLRDHVTGKLLAKKEQPLEVIAFQPFKTWTVFEDIKGKEQFHAIVPFDSSNSQWERQATIDKRTYVRYQTMNYYTLCPEEIKKGDARPRVLSLRSTNYKTGRKIETTRAFLKKMGVSLPFKTLELFTQKQENDKGTWFIIDVREGRKTEDVELDAVKEWVEVIQASRVIVDNSDLEHGEDMPSAPQAEKPDTVDSGRQF